MQSWMLRVMGMVREMAMAMGPQMGTWSLTRMQKEGKRKQAVPELVEVSLASTPETD